MPTPEPPPYAAVVLAGGRSRRMTGHPHKPAVAVAGASLLDRVLTAVADAAPRVVVGPPQPLPPGVLLVRESPPGGGPAAALAAGLAALTDPPAWVAVLAGDQPLLTPAAVHTLRRAAGPTGAVFTDNEGRWQLLCGVWSTPALRSALADVGDPAGAPVRRLLGDLPATPVPWTGPAPPPWYDCDTPEELDRARRWLEDGS